MSFVERSAKSLFLSELLSGMAMTLRYFFKPKVTLNYPHEKGPISLHRLQAVRGDLPGARHHHRG